MDKYSSPTRNRKMYEIRNIAKKRNFVFDIFRVPDLEGILSSFTPTPHFTIKKPNC